VDTLRDRFEEFDAQLNCALREPERSLVRTDHTGIIQLRRSFCECAALYIAKIGEEDRPTRTHDGALAGQSPASKW
jgi:hypothetical protein